MSTILTPPPDETRLVAVCLAASVALHGAALAISPLVRHAQELEPPRVLSVVLPEPAVAAPEPPPPPPRPAAAPPRPKAPPRIAPVPVPEPRVEAPRAAPAAAEPSPAPPAPETPAKEEAPPATSKPVVAAAPREPSTPPDFRAAYLRNPAPGYPAAARRNGEAGTVTLRVLVSVEGAPREVAIAHSSGSSLLDAAALASVKTWRFAPARRGGEPYEAPVLVPIIFRLEPST